VLLNFRGKRPGEIPPEMLELSLEGPAAVGGRIDNRETLGPRTFAFDITMAQESADTSLLLRVRVPQLGVDQTVSLSASASRLQRAPSGTGYCCPTRGDCNSFYIGGWTADDNAGRCSRTADGRGSISTGTDGQGCPTIQPSGSCLGRP
jgi:hypothetical protein